MRATIKLKRPITDLELDVDENSIIPKWIPCSERLPEYGKNVIVSVLDISGDTAFDYTATGWIGWTASRGDFWVVNGELCSGIIAWQPLPEPYREESNERTE